jgi:ATP-dependent DNA helicase PIF1
MSDKIGLIEDLIRKGENICIIGPAGSGKSYIARHLLQTNTSICAAASTGIAAVNIGGVTINSLLNFYDIGSLRAKIASGAINKKLIQLSGSGVKYILIDEVSMISAELIDLLLYAETTRAGSSKYPIRFILIGDPGQLPSINAAPFFEASLFHHFNIVKLEYIHRQSDIGFIRALNLIRKGNAREAVDFFFPNKEKYVSKIDKDFTVHKMEYKFLDREHDLKEIHKISYKQPNHELKYDSLGY